MATTACHGRVARLHLMAIAGKHVAQKHWLRGISCEHAWEVSLQGHYAAVGQPSVQCLEHEVPHCLQSLINK